MFKIGIVIPYYKINFFNDTLQSLANQTNQRFKVYIGDDASPESPLNLLEKYQDVFEFVYHRFENNLGSVSLTKQWDRCIALCNSEEWLMILGDDDVLSNNAVASFYDVIDEVEREKINVIRFATQKINGEGKPISKIYEHPKTEKAVNFLFNKTRSSLSEYIFKKQQLVKYKFKDFPLAWYSDVLAVFEFSNYGNIFSINNSVNYIRISDMSISGSSSYEKLKLQAKFDFYHYLIKNKLKYFSELEQKELLYRINKCYFNNKRHYAFFFIISKLYIKKKLFKEYFRFIRQIIYFSKKRKILK